MIQIPHSVMSGFWHAVVHNHKGKFTQVGVQVNLRHVTFVVGNIEALISLTRARMEGYFYE